MAMELSPKQLELQIANRKVRAKAAEKAGSSEAEAAAWGLPPATASFFSILTSYGGTDDNEVAIDMDQHREEWSRIGDDADDLLTEVRIYDLVEERDDGNLYITSLGREAVQHMF